MQEFAKGKGATLPVPFRSLPFPFFTLLPPFPLEVGPLKPARGSWERCKLPLWCPDGAPAENEFVAL